MKNVLGVVGVLVSSAVLVSSLKCWMCPGGSASFELCDGKKQEQTCDQDMTGCGTFSFQNSTGTRIYAKSCTYESWCTKNNTFCANIPGAGGKDCRVQCCHTELCNFQVGFATTSAPSTTALPTTTRRTTTTSTSTSPPTTEPTEKPRNPSRDPLSDDDEDDCSWVDGAGTAIPSGAWLILLAIHLAV